jgi:hypothetical protein
MDRDATSAQGGAVKTTNDVHVSSCNGCRNLTLSLDSALASAEAWRARCADLWVRLARCRVALIDSTEADRTRVFEETAIDVYLTDEEVDVAKTRLAASRKEGP